MCAGAVLESPRLAKSRACRRKMTPQNRGAKVLCFSTLTLKFSTRTPKVPFGPLGGASGIALFIARALGGLRAPFFVSPGGSEAAPCRLGGASVGPVAPPGLPWGVPGASRAICRRPRGGSWALSGASGRLWGGLGDLGGPPAPHGSSPAGVKRWGFSFLGPNFVVVSLYERAGYLG